MRNKDKLVKQQVEYKLPGASGEDIFWDFSEQKPVDKAYKIEYFSFSEDSTIIGREHRTLYKYKLNGDSLFCIGYQNSTSLINHIRPELLLSFPLRYQNQIQDYFYGEGEYSGQLELVIQGLVTTTVDAYGKMILPGSDTLNYVLRLHSVKRVIEKTRPLEYDRQEINTAVDVDSINYYLNTDSVIYQIETYRWYADGYRYPVFETVQMSTYKNNESVSNSNTAFYYTPEEQYYGLKNDSENTARREQLVEEERKRKELQKNESRQPKDEKPVSLDDKIKYNIFLDDNNNSITIDYQLYENAEISILLYDMQGRILERYPRVMQHVDSYTRTISLNEYPPGDYLLSIVVDKQVIGRKIAKSR